MKTVIEMAREAGFHSPVRADGYMGLAYDRREGTETGGSLERFAELVRADEREKLWSLETDAHFIFNNPPGETSQDVRDVIEWYAAAIRARSNT